MRIRANDQAKLNDKIRHSEATFESVSSVDVEIEMLEQKIAEAEDQRTRLQNDIRDAKYDEQVREKTLAIRHKEAEKDKVQAELSALNRQADSRAQLSIKKSELTAKSNQIVASSVPDLPSTLPADGSELRATALSSKSWLEVISKRKPWKKRSALHLANATERFTKPNLQLPLSTGTCPSFRHRSTSPSER